MIDLIEKMPSWVNWVFSGIGVAVLSWVGMLLFRSKSNSSQIQKAGDNSNQTMSGRDTKMGKE